jgi:hypothetical protein
LPCATSRPTANVTCDIPNPVIELGLKLAVIPLGNPTALKVIVPSNPSETTVLMVVVPLVPSWTVKVCVLLKAWLFKSTTANPGTGAGAEGTYSQTSLR